MAEAIGDLELLNDEDLLRAAENRLSDATRSQLEALNSKQQREKLTPAEKEALERLVHQYDQAVLLRAEAARLLKARGKDVSALLAVKNPKSAGRHDCLQGRKGRQGPQAQE